MEVLTREDIEKINEELTVENRILREQRQDSDQLLLSANKQASDDRKRQEMIKRMLISSGRITNEDFDLLERIVAPLDQ